MEKIKYPRTYHLPYSASKTDDDKTLETDEQFQGMIVVVTEKLDGENTTVYPDGSIHARSIEGFGKPWQDWVKSTIQKWCYAIPEGWRVCGENLQAKHSIEYELNSIEDAFQCFGIYNEKNECLPYMEMYSFCAQYNIALPNMFYMGIYDKDKIMTAFKDYCKRNSDREVEGFVVRNVNSFPYDEFNKNVAKYVRKNHVQTDEHWTKNWTNNKIKK